MNTALEYSTRVVQEGGCRCKKSTLNVLVHLTPLRIPLMNPPVHRTRSSSVECTVQHIFMKYIFYSITVFSPGIPPVHSYDNSQPFSLHLIPFSPLRQRVCIDQGGY
jgi:hypothetical protein